MRKLLMFRLLAVLTLLTPVAVFSQDAGSGQSSYLQAYYKISDALVKSNPADAAKSAKELGALLKPGQQKPVDGNTAAASDFAKKISPYVNTIAGSKDLEKQRAAFQNLSDAFIAQIKTQKQEKPAYVVYCPMKKASWISSIEEVKNPYYGNAMLTCGNISETIK